MRKLQQQLKSTEQRIIKSRQTLEANKYNSEGGSSSPPDLLDARLAAARDEDSVFHNPVIEAALQEMIIAGSNKTALTITATIFLLASHPSKLKRVLAEIERVAGQDELTLAHVDQLEYLNACLKEAMRLFPAANVIVRTASADATVGPYSVPGVLWW